MKTFTLCLILVSFAQSSQQPFKLAQREPWRELREEICDPASKTTKDSSPWTATTPSVFRCGSKVQCCQGTVCVNLLVTGQDSEFESVIRISSSVLKSFGRVRQLADQTMAECGLIPQTSVLGMAPRLITKSKKTDNSAVKSLSACNFDMYKQCDSRWGSQGLGFSSSNTICSAGCAMSSVAMMLGHFGTHLNPGQLNSWLKSHSGFASADLIVWNAVDVLGNGTHPQFMGIEKPDQAAVQAGLSACHGIIANVMNGEHWVLLTGYAGNSNYYVNDPGFNRATYPFDQMIQFAVYH